MGTLEASKALECLLPAEKGGLRRVDVSESVCLSVTVSFEFLLNFIMVIMGSFTQKHVLIQTDQSEHR